MNDENFKSPTRRSPDKQFAWIKKFPLPTQTDRVRQHKYGKISISFKIRSILNFFDFNNI